MSKVSSLSKTRGIFAQLYYFTGNLSYCVISSDKNMFCFLVSFLNDGFIRF